MTPGQRPYAPFYLAVALLRPTGCRKTLSRHRMLWRVDGFFDGSLVGGAK